MNDRLAQVRGKFARACEHDKAWSDLLDTWATEKQRYGFSARPDLLTDWIRVDLSLPEGPPERAAFIYADFVHNLRATLDYIVFQLVEANEKPTHKDLMFPVIDDGKDWKSAVNSQLRGFPARWLPEIKAAQPFQYGPNFRKHPLHLLNKLEIEGKHKTVVHYGVTGFDVNITPLFSRPKLLGDNIVRDTPRADRVELVDGDVVERLRAISHHDDLRIVGIKAKCDALQIGPITTITQGIGERLPDLRTFVGWVVESLAPAFPI